MLALHAPDGFLEPATAIATAVLSAAVLAFALRRSAAALEEKQLPLAGIAAAFIFAAQMVNFPVASGTTGHLLGGALAAILLGPATGAVVVAVVVAVQALLFADGGLSAVGYNTLNMAIVPAFGAPTSFMDKLEERGCIIVDTTCGDVMKVWRRVRDYAKKGIT